VQILQGEGGGLLLRCRICGERMVRDERFIKTFTYIIPYVCQKCGYRDSKMRSERVFKKMAQIFLKVE